MSEPKQGWEDKLWCDCKTDQERIEFLKSGRAWETGIIAKSLQQEIVGLIERIQQELDARTQEMIDELIYCKWDMQVGKCSTCLSNAQKYLKQKYNITDGDEHDNY